MTATKTEKLILQEMAASQKRLETAILGDADAGVKGLAQRVASVEKKANRHEKMIYVGGGVLAMIKLFWNKIFE